MMDKWGRNSLWLQTVNKLDSYDVHVLSWHKTSADAKRAERQEIAKRQPSTNIRGGNHLNITYKQGRRVYFVYPGKDARMLIKAIKASALSQSAFFVEAGKLLARVQMAQHKLETMKDSGRSRYASQEQDQE
jgi:hypothetical protein